MGFKKMPQLVPPFYRISFKRTIGASTPGITSRNPTPPKLQSTSRAAVEVPLNAPSLSFETAYVREKMWPFSWVAPRCFLESFRWETGLVNWKGTCFFLWIKIL